MGYRIHLVEDENNLNQILTSYLQKEGWDVVSFYKGEDAKISIDAKPHLWILDIMLPDIDGYQLIKEIKSREPNVPVIFISARDQDLDRILGLEMGGDDYLAKPFLPLELVIRTRKLLQRVYGIDGKSNRAAVHQLPPYMVDEEQRKVRHGEVWIDLTSKEFDLLLYLIFHRGIALSREQILYQVWGTDYFGSERNVDELMRRLRKKMPELRVETIYGYGYRMVKS